MKDEINLRFEKGTIVVGDYLFLVQGAVRWGLYDLKRESMTVIDKKSGQLIALLCKTAMSQEQKQAFLENHVPAIWDQIQRLEINDRLFKPNSSFESDKISLNLCWLELTDSCNQKCIHCYAESGPQRKTFICVELAKEVIRQTRKEGFRILQFTGGEPFLHPNFWEIIEYACALNFPEIEIYTNLTQVTKSDLIRIKKNSIKVATTLLGPNAKIHDSCTRTLGSFQRWYRNIKQVRSLGIPYRIAVVRMRQNEQAIEDIKKFLYDERLVKSNESFRIDDYRFTGRVNDVDMLPTKPPNWKLHLIVNSNFFHHARKYNTCWQGKIAIAPDGNVYPCVFARKITVGNISKEPFSIVIDRLKTYWAITLDQVDKCRDCEFRYACKDCRVLSLNLGKGLYGAPVRCNYDPYH